MRSFLTLSALAGAALANIHFHYVQPTCEFGSPFSTKCLRGQHCVENNTCAPDVNHEARSRVAFRRDFPLDKRQGAVSTDGTCGPANANRICGPNSPVYKGTCCSQYGWCGDTPAHCGTGCVSGCNNNQNPPPTQSTGAPVTPPQNTNAPPRADGRCGKDFGGSICDSKGAFGGCCSSYGYCGNSDGHCLPANGCQNGCAGAPASSAPPPVVVPVTTRPPSSTTSGEPVLGSPTPAPENPPANPQGPPTTDGTCGAKFGRSICGNWPQGACCSMYGYCGSTTSHCGGGCQSGPCLKEPAIPAPGPSPAPAAAKPGNLAIRGRSGVPAMHAGLMPNGRVVFLDKVENYTELKLANGRYAFSSEYDPTNQRLVPLSYKTNAFCSGGIFLADGRFASIGGNEGLEFMDPTVGNGFKGLRFLRRSFTDASLNGQDWVEPGPQLDTARWYASVQIMPNDQIFVASGSLNGLDPSVPANNNPTYEILNANGTPQGRSIPMEILDKNQPYYMYPFIHLLRDGNVFVFTSRSSEIFNVNTNAVVRMFPDLPGDYRTYPNSGGSILLPLSSADNYNPDIVICGGGAYQDITSPTDASCGRIKPLDTAAAWEMDSMPQGRGMVEGTLLADGTSIWVNGANEGAQGFEVARAPTLDVLIYDHTQPKGRRWTTGPRSTIPRLYHSVALLLLDGTLLISGSNPVEQPIVTARPGVPFLTEFRNEIYTPPYLVGNPVRPSAVAISSRNLRANGQTFTIKFNNPANSKAVKVSLYYGGFVTHSVHMGHRMVWLDSTGFNPAATAQTITVKMPPNRSVSPSGPYVIYVLVDGVPAQGQFVMVTG